MSLTGDKEVILCFLPLDSDLLERSYLNYAAGRIAPKRKYKTLASHENQPMVHVELWLKEKNSEDGYASSICYNKTVHWTKKSFSRKNWHFRSLYGITDQQYKKLKMFLSSQKGCPFNKLGFFLLGLTGVRLSGQWSTRFGWKPRYFCAELIVKGLKECGYFPDSKTAIPTCCHPEELWQYCAIISTPTSHPVSELEVGKFQY